MNEMNKSLDKALTILKHISMKQEVGLRELSRITGNSLSATEKIVKTLEEHNFIGKDQSGKIILGRELFFLGKMVESKLDSIKILLQEIEELVRDIDETVYLCQKRDEYIVFIEGVYSSHAIQYVPEIGKLYDLPYGATGYAFMSYMEHDELESILEHYQVEKEVILKKIPIIRENGYAMSYQERFEGLVGIAFPLVSMDGSVSYILDIAIPAYRFSEEKKEYIIMRAKKTIEKLLIVIG